MNPTILVISASVGAGHLRAAQAVELALRNLAPHANVQNLDILSLTNAPFRQLYAKAYLDLVNHAPHLLGYMYDMLDKPRRTNSRRDRFRLAFEKLNLSKFVSLLSHHRPDLVINTHFLPAEIIAHLRKSRKSSFPHLTVTTDFETHRLWVNQPCEHYFTATQEGAISLAAFGVPIESTTPTGIPIHPAFSQPADRPKLRAQHHHSGKRPVILQLAGGFGVGPIAKIFQSLLNIQSPLDIIVVTGRNADAKKQLASIPTPPRHSVHVLGFTDQIDQLMALADIVVSKPGGLTTSETLARGAAMLIVDPIPGQESRNSDFLLENGAALKVNNLAVLSHKLQSLLDDPTRLAQLRANASRLARPRAAFDIARHALQLLA